MQKEKVQGEEKEKQEMNFFWVVSQINSWCHKRGKQPHFLKIAYLMYF